MCNNIFLRSIILVLFIADVKSIENNKWFIKIQLYWKSTRCRHSAQFFRTFPGIFGDIPGNVWPHFPKFLATFPGMFGDIHRNVWRHSPECLVTFPGMFGDILRNVWRHSPECLVTFPRMFGNIPRNITLPLFPAFPAFRSLFLCSWFYTYPVLILLLLEPQFSQWSNSSIDNAIFKFCRIDIKKLFR